MPAPTLLSREQMQAQYGVNPDQAQGWDAQNKRYNTSQSGQYLYHGDLGGGQIGWYAGAQPYDTSGGSGSGGGGAMPPSPPASPRVDPSLQQVTPVGQNQALPYATPVPIGSPNGAQRGQSMPTDGAGTATSTNPDGTTRTTVADDFGTGATSSDPMEAALRSAILSMLNTNVNDASVTDADIAPQSRAFAAATNQSAAARRAEMMETAAHEGTLSSGATNASLDALSQQTGQAIGANDASLIGSKLDARRAQLNAAIQVANQRGMAQEANDLQRQLANLNASVTQRGQDVSLSGQQLSRDLGNLDAQSKVYLADLDAQLRREGYSEQDRLAQLDAKVREMGITSQQSLGQLDIALRQQLGIGQLNLGWLQALLQNNQAGNALGFDIGKMEAILNGQAVGGGG
jgi:hypothetical protein